MLAVLEKSLPPFESCEFDVDHPLHGLPPRPELAATIREDFVPAVTVTLPQIRSLGDAHALSQARESVAAALDDLRQAETALEQRLTSLREYMRQLDVST